MMKFVVSATAFRNEDIKAVIPRMKQTDLILEFSSGIPYAPDLVETYLAADCKKLIHNYFPAPAEPFVLNLGSMEPAILEKSRAHVANCLRLSAQSKTEFYSVHAGFCLDPDPSTLGRKLKFVPRHPREKHWEKFLESVDLLHAEAKKYDVRLVIENNVLAPFNVLPDGQNPTLCCAADEIVALCEKFKSPFFGLLLDTGHWKVSAQTLRFDRVAELKKILPHISAVHHSDNDGTDDTNGPLGSDYWFLPFMKKLSGAYHVLEVHDQNLDQIRTQFSLLENAAAQGM